MMDPRIPSLLSLLELQSRLYLNCLAGMTDEQSLQRPSEQANHIAFLALHLLDSRFVLARLVERLPDGRISTQTENPFAHLLANARGIGDVAAFPTLDELRSSWRSISGVLTAHCERLSPSDLDQPCPPSLPVLKLGEGHVIDAIAFLLHHEGYHIGQMALLRKLCGLPAMSYR